MVWSLHRRRNIELRFQVLVLLLASRLACASDVVHLGAAHLDAVQGVNPSCAGFEEERVSCPGLPECVACQPIDCVFGIWSTWSSMGGCIDLCERSRVTATPSNECGTPCTGIQRETKKCPQANCTFKEQNCVYSAWSAWDISKCTVSSTEQQTRQKTVIAKPEGAGAIPCTGSVNETKPCAVKALPAECALSQWSQWGSCSATCDTGTRTRSRVVVTEAAHGGLCPDVPLEVVQPCPNLAACNVDTECIFGQWSDWGVHGGSYAGNTNQWFRSRAISQDATNEGKRCTGSMFEVKGAVHNTNDCTFGGWSAWTPCSKSCGVGQHSRTRTLLPYTGVGECPLTELQETAVCNPQVCGVACAYGPWGAWSACSSICGAGTHTRSRTTLNAGEDCDAVLEEAASCVSSNPACSVQDAQACQWGDWEAWGPCSVTCGNGTQGRLRDVSVPPGKDGQQCAPLSKSEMQTCNLGDCNALLCTNGEWADWTVWTPCTSTCDSGYTTRTRAVKVQATYCGIPAIGSNAEFANCSGPPCNPTLDCVIGQWSQWTACAPSCFGVSHRSRIVTQPASGDGKACSENLAQMKPCNPGAGEPVPEQCKLSTIEDCALADWKPWSGCTADCGGLRERQRAFQQLPTHGGKTCNMETLGVLEMCNGTQCTPDVCVDCKWSPWNEWSACGMCKGQQSRSRHIVEMPTYCGKLCDERITEETRNCTGACPQIKYCVFGEWTGDMGSQCLAAPCGHPTFKQTRSMIVVDVPAPGQEVLAQGSWPNGLKCNGVELRTGWCSPKPCNATSCTPVNCVFGEWSTWSTPDCSGYVSRQRAILVAAKCGGSECNGALAETKPQVSTTCNMPFDCQFASWSEWTPCGPDPTAQRTRGREIRQMPRNGGQGCTGSLLMTIGCHVDQAPQNCEFQEWSQWSACPVTCGGDVQKRERLIVKNAAHFGDLCAGADKEIRACGIPDCPVVGAVQCEWQPWSDWECNGITSQKKRERSFLHTTPEMLKGACIGEYKQIEPCEVEGWTIPPWTAWSACDKTCGGGQKTRTRQGIQPPTQKRDGTPTPNLPYNVSLSDIAECNTALCPDTFSDYVDCALNPWGAWSACSSSCGLGYHERSRTQFTSMRGIFGSGCHDPMSEIAPCSAPTACPAPVNCKWSSWSTWTACNAECGGGETFRSRDVEEAPLFGGASCPGLSKEEMKSCNTMSCQASGCIDGEWGTWNPWSTCVGFDAAACTTDAAAHGIQERSRSVHVAANDCGHPVHGPTRQFQDCSLPICKSVPCVFSDWSAWSLCPGECDGVKRRERNITQVGSPDQACDGALVETTNCPRCLAPKAVDCRFSDWFDGECTVSCGGGRYVRTRTIEEEAKNGGAPCDGHLKVVKRCSEQVCENFAPVDCQWGAWGDWSACTQCGSKGVRTKKRDIAQLPLNAGKPCTAGDAEKQAPCPDACPKTYCTWGDWQAFGACTATCGNATKTRRRFLYSSTLKPIAEIPDKSAIVAKKYAELEAQIAGAETKRTQDLSIAFTVGAIGCLVLLIGVRTCALSHFSRSVKTSYSRMSQNDEADRYSGPLAQSTYL